MIRDNLNCFINRNVGEQGSNVEAGHNYVIGVDVTVQEFLNKRERVLDDEGANRNRSEERNQEFSYFIRIVINTK